MKGLRSVELLSKTKERFVVLVQNCENGHIFVLNKISNNVLNETAFEMAVQKINNFDCLSIVTFFSYYEPRFEGGEITLAIPYYINSSLKKMIQKERIGKYPLSWNYTKKSMVIYSIAFGMQYLHSHGFFFELTSSNVLLNSNFDAVITDYWLPNFLTLESNKTSPMNNESDTSSLVVRDIISFSLIIKEMITLKDDSIPYDVLSSLKGGSFADLMQKCSNPPTKGFTFSNIIEDMVNNKAYFHGTNDDVFIEHVNRLNRHKNNNRRFNHARIPDIIDNKELFEHYKKETENGDSIAKYISGIYKKDGKGCTVNKQAAVKLLKQSADVGVSEAEYLLSTLMSGKQKNSKNRTESIQYLMSSAVHGHPGAQFLVAKQIIESHTIVNEKSFVISLLESSYHQGIEEARHLLILFYENNHELSDDLYESLVKRSAHNGYSNSQLKYAKYLISKDISRYKKDIAEMLIRSSFQGEIESMNLLSNLMDQQKLSLTNRSEEIVFYRFAAEKGVVSAMNAFSLMVAFGIVTLEDDRFVAKYLKIAADNGEDIARLEYGDFLLQGKGVPKNPQLAYHYFKLSADSGNPESAYKCAKVLIHVLKSKNSDEILYYLNIAANSGIVEAQRDYSTLRFMNKGTDEEMELADRYLRIAADQKDPIAMYEFSKMILDSPASESDKEQGLQMLREAATQGHVRANFVYGKKCIKGDCLEEDKDNAINFIRVAAQGGDPQAQFLYGKLLLCGKLVDQNITEAIEFLELASKQKVKEASYQLGMIYLHGNGVNIDEKRAAKYMKQSVDYNYGPAIKEYRQMLVEGKGVLKNPNQAFCLSLRCGGMRDHITGNCSEEESNDDID